MKICTFDIEASKWTNFELLGFYNGEEYKLFYCLEAFLDEVLRKKYRAHRIFAHFGGKYDFNFILPLLMDREYKIELIETGSRIIEIKVKLNKKDCVYFSDSFALLPFSLRKLTESFNVLHKKGEFDFENGDFQSEECKAYLRSDTIGLYEVLIKFANWGLHKGSLKKTIASQSLHVFKNRYLKHHLIRLSEKQDEFIRKCYFGGRCEIFKMIGQNLKYYDFNSLYPSVMMEKMPTGQIYYTNKFQKNKIGFYRAEIKIPLDCYIPPIPVIIDKKLIFPVGEFTAFVSGVELELLSLVGGEFEVLEGYFFEKREYLFKEYISDLYKIKQTAKPNSVDYIAAKLELNALYGKFAQKKKRESIIRPANYQEVIDKGYKAYNEEFGLYIKETESFSDSICPYVSAHITALARVKLYRAFHKLNFNVWYTDTDSITSNEDLPTSNKLGDLKKEHDILEGVFLQPKGYSLIESNFKELTRMKGFREHNLKFSDFKRVLFSKKLDEIRAEYYRICGYRENIKRFKDLKIKRIKVLKQLRKMYDKRIINDDFSTSPIILKKD